MTTALENSINTTNLSKISFPVFPLLKEKPAIEENIVYYLCNDELRVVDDTSLPFDSLGQRRLNLLKIPEVKLFKISKALYFLGDIIKITQGSHWFIDDKGFIFEYRKTKRVPLEFFRIREVIPIKSGGAILEISGLPTRYKCMYQPKEDEKYAGLLKLSPFEYILYGVYSEKFDDTFRKI